MKSALTLDANGVATNIIAVEDGADLAALSELFEKRIVIGPVEACAGWRLDGEAWTPPQTPSPSLDELRERKVSDIQARSHALLAIGAPVSDGLHVALDDGSRADLTAMAATATAAASGALPWPDSYSRGWISMENVRIPLATPAAGLTLAATAGDYYAAIVQHRRDLKDAALAAENAEALDAIVVSAGWPD